MWDGPTLYAAIIGSLGFAVAAASLGWQIVKDHRERATRVRVDITRTAVWSPRMPDDQLLVVTATNESSHPVEITKVGLSYRHPPGTVAIAEIWGWDKPPEATIPGTIPPRGSGMTTTLLRLGGHWVAFTDDETALSAYVYIADGTRFDSEWWKAAEIPSAVHLTQIPVAETTRRMIAQLPIEKDASDSDI